MEEEKKKQLPLQNTVDLERLHAIRVGFNWFCR